RIYFLSNKLARSRTLCSTYDSIVCGGHHMAKTLTERAFSQLAVELKTILTAAQAASSAEKSAGYWALGKRITQAKLSQELGYHNTVLRELATTLDVSTRTLQQAVLFYTVYPELPKDGLSWAHYRLLSRLRV